MTGYLMLLIPFLPGLVALLIAVWALRTPLDRERPPRPPGCTGRGHRRV